MFKITQGKGVHIRFQNGYSISIQWGPGNYCENYSFECDRAAIVRAGEKGSATAEIAVMDPFGNFCGQQLGLFSGDDVEGWATPERVAEVIAHLVALEE